MMQSNKKRVVGLALLAVAVAGAYWGWSRYHAPARAAAEADVPPAQHMAADTLRFAADAPQLTFLKIEQIDAFPEPLVEPLNAHISYDDNHTARVFSPLAGRVVRIAAEAGQ